MQRPLVDQKYKLEKVQGKGGWTFVVIEKLVQAKKAPFGWVKVKGKIDDFELTGYRLMPMANGNLFLPVRAEIRKKIGKKEGDSVHIVLYADDTPLDIPEELVDCLKDEPKAYQNFMKLTEAAQKEYCDWVYSAKREETKVDRIAKMIDMLVKGLRLTASKPL